jgi:hypothetical protein
MQTRQHAHSPRSTTLLCPALRQGAPSGAGYGRLRVLALPCARFGGRRPGTSAFSLSAVHEGRSLMKANLAPERTGGRRPKSFCATPRRPIIIVMCKRPAPSACQVESTRAARVISPTSSRASAARLNGAVRALAKARPLLCAAAAACNAHHYYDCLSLFFHLQLRVAALSSPRDTTASLSLPPRHALTGYACAPPANILRGW